MFPLLAKLLLGVLIGGAIYVLTKDKIKNTVKEKVKESKDKNIIDDAVKAKIKEKLKKGETTRLEDLKDYDENKEAIVVDVLSKRNKALAQVTIFADKINDDVSVGDIILLN